MSSNPFMEELEKLANDLTDEPMNPDNQPVATEEDVAETQAQNSEIVHGQREDELHSDVLQPSEAAVVQEIVERAVDEELAAQGIAPEGGVPQEQPIPEDQATEQEVAPSPEGDVVEAAAQGIPQEEEELLQAMNEEKVASAVRDTLTEKVANELISLATLAKIAQCARGGEGISDELEKEASSIIEEMVQGEEQFANGLERVASEMFAIEENVSDLFTQDGLFMVFEQLAALDGEGMDKQADEDTNMLVQLKNYASGAISSAKNKVMEAANSAMHLREISKELEQASAEIQPTMDAFTNHGADAPKYLSPEDVANFSERKQNVNQLTSKLRSGQVGLGVAGGLAAAGAAYGGKKLYDHRHPEEEEKIAGVLPDGFSGGTLNAVQENDYTGGIQKMAKELVKDFLKVAGAAGLVSITNDENQPEDFRKQASEAFDTIAMMNREDMDSEFVKVAQQIYSEDELHEIVAGQHTDHLREKVAFFVDSVDASYDEVFEKTANAGGVAAVKNVGPGLKDSLTNIENTIKQSKEKTEAGGREYVGEVTNGGKGKAGGGLVGDNLEGYSALKNPAKYDIEQTASALEEAFLSKQAAVQAYANADSFIKQYIKN